MTERNSGDSVVADIAALIPGATVHEAACGHAGCVLEHRTFVPALLEAAHATTARMRDVTKLRANVER